MKSAFFDMCNYCFSAKQITKGVHNSESYRAPNNVTKQKQVTRQALDRTFHERFAGGAEDRVLCIKAQERRFQQSGRAQLITRAAMKQTSEREPLSTSPQSKVRVTSPPVMTSNNEVLLKSFAALAATLARDAISLHLSV